MLQGLMLVVLLTGVAAPAAAQDDREARLRTVRGTVVDKDENPMAEAVVYLKNVKTAVVRTTISGRDGQYRLSGLDPNVDYEIHAEHGGNASSKRSISSFESRREFVIHLKVNKKKE
jgi:hypothetical protein